MIKSNTVITRLCAIDTKYSHTPSRKVLKFRHHNNGIMSDEDIKCLFLGLYNLVKNNIRKQVDSDYRLIITRFQNSIDNKNAEIKKLEDQLKKLEEKCNIVY